MTALNAPCPSRPLWDQRCPACGRGAMRCLERENTRGTPCCGDCLAQPRQLPMHVWPRPEQPAEVTREADR